MFNISLIFINIHKTSLTSGNNFEKSLVIGGEACLWAEFADGTNTLSRLW